MHRQKFIETCIGHYGQGCGISQSVTSRAEHWPPGWLFLWIIGKSHSPDRWSALSWRVRIFCPVVSPFFLVIFVSLYQNSEQNNQWDEKVWEVTFYKTAQKWCTNALVDEKQHFTNFKCANFTTSTQEYRLCNFAFRCTKISFRSLICFLISH